MLKLFSQLHSFTEVFGELKNLDFPDERYEKQATILKSDWTVFRESLEKRIEEQDTFDKLSIFIRDVQKNLTSFSNKFFELFKNYEAIEYGSLLQIQQQYRNIGQETTEVLNFLQKNYPEYFDFSEEISLWKIYTNKEAYTLSNQIIWNFQQRNVDHELIDILSEHLSILYDTNNPKSKNWYQFEYMDTLAAELYKLSILPKEQVDTLRLIKLLMGYNFNPLVFYEFMLEFSARIAGEDMPYEDQKMELLALLKVIDNIRLECKHGYNLEVLPISQSVGDSIRRDLKIIDKMKTVYFPDFQNSKENGMSNFYFEMNTTLEELFFLNRIMLEIHFIKTKYKSNLYKFIERHVRTGRTNKPSQQYMRNIFGPNKEVPTRVVKKIRMWLMMMVNFIDTNFKDQLKVWPWGFMAISFQDHLTSLCFSIV